MNKLQTDTSLWAFAALLLALPALSGAQGGGPSIDVAPESLSSKLEPGQMETQELTIANLGGATLDWEVADEVKIFERAGVLTLVDVGEAGLLSAVIDPTGEFAYFGTGTFPGRVVKIDLETFERVGAITLGSGEAGLVSAVIDPASEFAYFGTNASPGRVVKIRLRGPDCTLPDWASVDPASGSLPGGGDQTAEVTFDSTGLDFGDYEANLCLASNDSATPLVVVPLTLSVTEPELAFDPSALDFGDVEVGTTSPAQTATLHNLGNADATGLAFSLSDGDFAADTGDCGTTLVAGGSCEIRVTFTPTAAGPATAPLEATADQGAAATLDLGGNGVISPPQIDVDPESLAATLEPGQMEPQSLTIANLGSLPLDWEITEGVEILARVGGITLGSGEDHLSSAVIDPTGAFAYFGTDTDPGRVVKIDLETFERVDAITLSGVNNLRSAVIDPTGEFAYFGTSSDAGQVVKIDLGTFEQVDAITLSGVSGLRSAVIDPTGEFAYFGTSNLPRWVVKIDLGTFEQVDAITLDGVSGLTSAVIDPTGEFAYFGTLSSPGQVVKIDLEAFEWVDTITLDSGESNLEAATIDPMGAFAYFGTNTFTGPGRVVKVDLETFERVDSITLESNEKFLSSVVIDPTGEFAYFGTTTILPGRVVKIGLRVPACTLPDWASVDPVSGSLPGGGEQTMDVTFDAGGLELGDYAASLCLDSNDPVTPRFVVPLTLTVTELAEPVLTFDPASLDFGDVEVGTTSPAQTATLHNLGNADATGLAFSLSDGAFDADTSDCGTTLPPAGSCLVGVTFAPTVTGPAASTLTVDSAEGAAPSVDLAGHGVSKTEVFSPVALEVDYAVLASDGNRVFEPGEIVDVAPAWRHDGLFEQALTGAADELTGPDGPSYDVVTAAADYGIAFPGETASCQGTGLCYQMDVGPVGVARPARHWDASFEETLSDETVATWTLHLGDSFLDVPRTSPFYRFVETLLHAQVTSGCSDTQYCPSGVNLRAQTAVFVLKALEGPGYAPPPCDAESQVFADVPFDSAFCPWVEELFGRGVVVGCGGGNYCPANPTTRGQMAVFLLKTLEGDGYTPPACAGAFADVACPSAFADWVEELYNREVTRGCASDPLRYCPASPVNRQQMAVFVSKTFGLVLYGP